MKPQEEEGKDAVERGRLGRLTKGRRITGPERDQLAAQLRDRYAQGATIRELMEQTGRSYGWTHRLLQESGAVLRGRGGAHPQRRTDPARAAAGPGTHARQRGVVSGD